MPGKSWTRAALDELAIEARFLRPTDPGYTAYTSDVVLEGRPDAVARPSTEAEVQEILAGAKAHVIPVTCAGGQTSLTGSSVAEEGILLATGGIDRFLDLHRDPETGGMTATAEAGILLGTFQRGLEAEGWYYPPDPTSRNEACLGATVATNATGEDSLLYGSTRRWVRELQCVLADGSLHTLRRPPGNRPVEEKATAGYYDAEHPVDLLIGSEGTLAVITRVTVDVLPRPGGLFAGLAFFPSLRTALQFAVAARRHPSIVPRALELMDRNALDLVAGNPEGISWPASTGAAISFRQEFRDENDRARLMDTWADLLETHLTGPGTPGFLERVLMFEDRTGRERLRTFRHRIPSVLNEVLARTREHGGTKVGTDWWVPYERIPEFLERWRDRIMGTGLKTVIFGHVGNGHPHVNFLPGTSEERDAARRLVLEMCREAVDAGGGVAGEHGLGKLRRELLGIQHAPARIRAMREIKTQWDPDWILGRGNLFT